jgi:hypothetical protein
MKTSLKENYSLYFPGTSISPEISRQQLSTTAQFVQTFSLLYQTAGLRNILLIRVSASIVIKVNM